jgi:hypothetical protein
MTQTYFQFIVHQVSKNLPIPFELVDVIKSFAFYDKVTAKTMKQKKMVTKMIQNAYSTKTMKYMGENDGNWAFWAHHSDPDFENYKWKEIGTDSEAIQFQGVFCLSCGNYRIPFDYDKIQCHCAANVLEDEWFHQQYQYEDDPFEDDWGDNYSDDEHYIGFEDDRYLYDNYID